MQIRSKLIKLRVDKKLTQKDIAPLVGVTVSYYGMIELGKRTPRLILARKIADLFEVKVEDIFFDQTQSSNIKLRDLIPTGTDG